MKKKGLTKKVVIIMASAMALMLCACGSTDSKSNAAEVISEKAVAEATSEEASTESAEEITSEEASTEEETVEEVTEEVAANWFESASFSVSPTGEYELLGSQYNYEGEDRLDTTEEALLNIPFSVSITESTEDCDPGYKNIIVTVDQDLSGWLFDYRSYRYFTFFADRYSGEMINGCNFSDDNPKRVVETKDNQLVELNYTSTNDMADDFQSCHYEYVINCPEDYDGLMYIPTYADLEAEISLGKKFYYMDDFPYLADYVKEDANKVFFFTATNN